ncbi:MAG: DUF1330 domain-containing protein [Chloroflexi bacterium]|nr:DUF1330 domain-containing protein [Chloroflexota bacterium]
MAGYVIADVEVLDPVEYETYRQLVPASLAAYGGRFIVRGGATEVMEGDWRPRRLVVLEFDSVERARAWYESEEYRAARAIRQRASRSSIVIVAGV